jgi:hypothetical protein
MMRFRVASVLLALGLLAGSTGMASHAWAAQAGPAGKMVAKGKKAAAAGTKIAVLQLTGMT